MSQIFDITLGRWRPLTTADLATGGGGGGGTVGGALETTQVSVLTAVQNVDVNIGAKGDATASSDSGTFSTIALVKRGLANWTTLLGRIPALVGGRIPVDASGVTQPVSAAALPLPAGAATESTLTAASGKLPATLGGKAASASLSVTAATGVATSISGTVTSGGTAQLLAAANTARRGLTLQNTSGGELRVSPFGTAGATAGYRVSAGDLLVLDSPHCGVGAVSVWGATTGQSFVGGEAV